VAARYCRTERGRNDDVTVVEKAISSLTADADLVVTHSDLTDRARQRAPSAIHGVVDDFMASRRYDEVVELVTQSLEQTPPAEPAPRHTRSVDERPGPQDLAAARS
jgi:mannitol PTS system EIICBA or EIICB component